jgi:hypothetical protein
MGLRRPKAVIEGGEELGAELCGDDSVSSPVGRIGAALDQFRGFQVIEEVGHDRSVDSEVLGQGELATDSALSGGRKDLIPARATRKVGHRSLCGLGVRPQDHAQAPSEIAGQGTGAAGSVANIGTAIGAFVHPLIIAKKRCPQDPLSLRPSADPMICVAYGSAMNQQGTRKGWAA